MRVLVWIRQVLDPHGVTINRRAGRVFVNREEYLANPADRNALEAALALKDADPTVEVVAAAAGPERVDAVLREALAMGADRAVRLPDPGPAGDGGVTAALLAAAAARLEDCDLAVLGAGALDLAADEVGPRLAHALGVPFVAQVHVLRVTDGALEAVAAPVGGTGLAALRISLPVVVTVPRDANRPRYPHATRLIRAYRDDTVEVWDAETLSLDPAVFEPHLVRGEAEAPPELSIGEMAHDVSAVANLLRPFVVGK